MDAPRHCMSWMYKFSFEELSGKHKSDNREHFSKKGVFLLMKLYTAYDRVLWQPSKIIPYYTRRRNKENNRL